MLPDPPDSLTEALQRAARYFPERGITLLDGRNSETTRSYPEVLAAARAGAERWAAKGVQPGDRIVVAVPSHWTWFETWMGAMHHGAIPVALSPGPAMGTAEAHVRKTAALSKQLGARFVVVPERIRETAIQLGLEDLASRTLTGPEFESTAQATSIAPTATPTDTAFLQLTSGSTGIPRAAQITHQCAVQNGLAIDEALGVPLGAPAHLWLDSVVSWLPLNHDMGLVGCLFFAMLTGADLRLLQPSAFLRRPRRWLEEHSRSGKTFAPAPNFGYQLCVERLAADDLSGLDLSGWKAAVAGAEMVRPAAMADFCEAFAPLGFRPEAVRPSYGLAEGTVAVTVDQRGLGVRTSTLPAGSQSDLGVSEVVCLGGPVADTELRMTDSAGTPLGEFQTGHLEVSGPGVFSGYWNDPTATAEALSGRWLRTGDRGFLRDGELYLTGRSKDILILNGHNVMPHEIEWLAEAATDSGGAARTGAFSVVRSDDRGEEAVLVVEVQDRDPDKLAHLGHEIRSRVGRTLSLPLADLLFVRRGKIPRTTSGKVRRRQLREQYLAGDLDRL